MFHAPRRLRTALAASFALLAGGVAAPAAHALPEIPGKIKVVEKTQVNANTFDLKIESPYVDSFFHQKMVRVVTPANYASRTDWPVIWGLHGGLDDHKSWYDKGGVPALATKTKAIWVLPETSWCSAYSDWKDGSQSWETYVLGALRPLIQQYYGGSGPAAVFGNSMGGLGATKFASKLWGGSYGFKAVATFSGNVDPQHHYPGGTGFDYPGLGCGTLDWKRVWGDPAVAGNTWAANDPWTQAPGLKASGAKVFISAGTNQNDPVEKEVLKQAQEYNRRVKSLGVVTDYREYPGGSHGWTDWTKALNDAWPLLAGAIGAK